MTTLSQELLDRLRVDPKAGFDLNDHDPAALPDSLQKLSKAKQKAAGEKMLEQNRAELAEAQDLLYADDRHSLLLVFQARDAAGKDSTIKHVMSGVNPQGCAVTSFKAPSADELDHNFLWRSTIPLPARGMIGIFNRSYYEEVLVVRVHPQILDKQRLPEGPKGNGRAFWKARFEDINNFEKHLARNGTTIVKFFLNVSKEEQKNRLLARLDEPAKNWKFEAGDLRERALWDDYQHAYQEALTATSTPWAPWYVIPADRKWAMRAAVSDIIVNTIKGMDLRYPELSEKDREELAASRVALEAE